MTLTPENFWAKLSPDRTAWHPLVAHCADVGGVMTGLLHPSAPFRRILARAGGLDDLSEDHVAQLVYLTILHDFGKANHGFQDKGFPRPPRRWPRSGHVKVVVESLTVPELRDWLGAAIEPFASRDSDPGEILLTAVCHHGRPWRPDGRSAPAGIRELWRPHPDHGRDPLAELSRLRKFAVQASGVGVAGGPGLPWTSVFSHEFAGILTLADWLGSSIKWFPFEPEAEQDPQAYWEQAVERGTNALRDVGLVERPTVVQVGGEPLLEALFPETFPEYPPTALQQAIVEMPLPGPGSRVVIESETGSGKTEAAIALYARLRAAGVVAGLVFALPTRATAHAMVKRVRRAVERVYPERRPIVALASGGVGGAVAAEGEVAEWNSKLLHEDDRDSGERRVPWATEHHKRFFAAEIVVGTVDQVLLAGLPVRHANLRFGLLSRHLIVIDEVHSYDRYMSSVLRNLMDPLARVGAVVALLSATVSDSVKGDYAHGSVRPRTLDEAVRVPYPLLSVSCSGEDGWNEMSVVGQSRAAKSVVWQLSTEDRALVEGVEAARAGASVLVIVNTVRDARRIATELLDAGAGHLIWRPSTADAGVIYHSRYAKGDRDVLDQGVLESFGPTREAGHDCSGSILVATQVAEQSLDIDFDLLVSFIAPIDVLLQRLGRLHRHPRERRALGDEVARALVIVPDGSERGDPQGWKGGLGHGWGEGSVYESLEDLEMTRRVIAERSIINIPQDNRVLIESVYHPEVRESLEMEPEWAPVVSRGIGRDFAQRIHAADVALPLGHGYVSTECFTAFGLEDRIRTRLGDDSVDFTLETPIRCWYARDALIQSVPVPLRVLMRGRQAADHGTDGATTRFDDLDFETALPQVSEFPNPTYLLPGGSTISYTPWGWMW